LDLGWSLVYMVADRQIGLFPVLVILSTLSAGIAISSLPAVHVSAEREPEDLPDNPYA
jgi:hypothetical protein